jgi:4-amino-4-deoxychorismate lyase
MSLLIESIKLVDGEFFNLSYHEQRMNRSLKSLCGMEDFFDLALFLEKCDNPVEGLFKCRITYDDQVQDVEFLPYEPKPVESLKIVESDSIEYEFKYKDRSNIDKLFKRRKGCDDILIVKDDLVTDSSYSNVVFRKGTKWITPWSALLKGTMRQSLIEQNIIQEEDIRVEDIRDFDSCRIINAMLGFNAPEIDVKKIVF